MDSERPNHQSADHESPGLDPRVIDPSIPLPPRCRTFRLSEIPVDMNVTMLRDHWDSLQVGTGFLRGNSKVFSLATYSSWQVATVSFHEEPDDFQRCKPGNPVDLQLSKRQVATAPYHQEPDAYKRCKPGHEVHLRSPNSNGQVETRAEPVRVTIYCDFYGITPLYQPVGTTVRYE
jgi:hypothetical protein